MMLTGHNQSDSDKNGRDRTLFRPVSCKLAMIGRHTVRKRRCRKGRYACFLATSRYADEHRLLNRMVTPAFRGNDDVNARLRNDVVYTDVLPEQDYAHVRLRGSHLTVPPP
jgi:hypothetical protein